jgi:hypothetical protein
MRAEMQQQNSKRHSIICRMRAQQSRSDSHCLLLGNLGSLWLGSSFGFGSRLDLLWRLGRLGYFDNLGFGCLMLGQNGLWFDHRRLGGLFRRSRILGNLGLGNSRLLDRSGRLFLGRDFLGGSRRLGFDRLGSLLGLFTKFVRRLDLDQSSSFDAFFQGNLHEMLLDGILRDGKERRRVRSQLEQERVVRAHESTER